MASHFVSLTAFRRFHGNFPIEPTVSLFLRKSFSLMNFKIHPDFEKFKPQIREAFEHFNDKGEVFMLGSRNHIRLFEIDGKNINVKSFKIPIWINKIAYRYFRKSKAKRSYESALILLEKGIGTPLPVAYQENFGIWGLTSSYYASLHLDYDLTYRELVEIKDFPDEVNILRQFTRFCWKMHEAGIEFKDHSPGNTLVKKKPDGQYEFFLVDLNRMKFHEHMDTDMRMKNLSRLTPKKTMVKIMADEYAKISGEDPEKLFRLLWDYTSRFQYRYHRRQNLKKKLKTIFKRK